MKYNLNIHSWVHLILCVMLVAVAAFKFPNPLSGYNVLAAAGICITMCINVLIYAKKIF